MNPVLKEIVDLLTSSASSRTSTAARTTIPSTCSAGRCWPRPSPRHFARWTEPTSCTRSMPTSCARGLERAHPLRRGPHSRRPQLQHPAGGGHPARPRDLHMSSSWQKREDGLAHASHAGRPAPRRSRRSRGLPGDGRRPAGGGSLRLPLRSHRQPPGGTDDHDGRRHSSAGQAHLAAHPGAPARQPRGASRRARLHVGPGLHEHLHAAPRTQLMRESIQGRASITRCGFIGRSGPTSGCCSPRSRPTPAAPAASCAASSSRARVNWWPPPLRNA
jgi:hypothetical protein